MSLKNDAMREYMRRRRKDWKDAGLCVSCGRELAETDYYDYANCEDCRAKARKRTRRYLEKNASNGLTKEG